MVKKRIEEKRAFNNKELEEKRVDLINEMDTILNKAKEEKRALDTEEDKRFLEIEKEINLIDKTIKADEIRRSLENNIKINNKGTYEEKRALEEENFLKFIKGEQRALDVTNNGGLIPTTIANRIIEKVEEICPIYQMSTKFNVKGDLVFPVYDEENSSIGAVYSDDMQELTEGTGKFKTIKLENYVVGSLAKISKSLINRTDFDLVSYVIDKVAQAISKFLEKELIKGSTKMKGLITTENIVTTLANDKITADELIDLQDLIPDKFQDNACWIMNRKTRKAIRKLKDNEGNYLLNKDLTNKFGWMLLGKPVFISNEVDEIGSEKTPVFYGDMQGLYVKMSKDLEIQMLLEKYATQHAVGIVAYSEVDSKIVETEKISAMKMKK